MSATYKPILPATTEMLSAFMERVDQRACWVWTGPYNRWTGYGSHKGFMAHRVAYEWLVEPIPEKHQIVHLCRVRHCVKPDHLEALTPHQAGRRAWMMTLSWRGLIQRAEKVLCNCWSHDTPACERPRHVGIALRSRVRPDGLRPGDRVPIRRIQMISNGKRCPQCSKVVAEGPDTGCSWCGLTLAVDGDQFLVIAAATFGEDGEIRILDSRLS